jgi:hypothetical protein
MGEQERPSERRSELCPGRELVDVRLPNDHDIVGADEDLTGEEECVRCRRTGGNGGG